MPNTVTGGVVEDVSDKTIPPTLKAQKDGNEGTKSKVITVEVQDNGQQKQVHGAKCEDDKGQEDNRDKVQTCDEDKAARSKVTEVEALDNEGQQVDDTKCEKDPDNNSANVEACDEASDEDDTIASTMVERDDEDDAELGTVSDTFESEFDEALIKLEELDKVWGEMLEELKEPSAERIEEIKQLLAESYDPTVKQRMSAYMPDVQSPTKLQEKFDACEELSPWEIDELSAHQEGKLQGLLDDFARIEEASARIREEAEELQGRKSDKEKANV